MSVTVTDLIFEKGLPAAVDAERLVLGSIMIGRPVANVAAALSVDDFSLEKHRRIFTAMLALDEAGGKVDRVTVAYELQRRGQLESVDGLTYLVSLDEGLPQIVNLDQYVAIVHEKAILRRAIFSYQQAINECILEERPTPEILDRSERAIAALATGTRTANLRAPFDVIQAAGGIEAIVYPKRGGVETPWPTLNRMLSGHGFRPGQMIVIGARPSMGKTALGCQIADHAASRETGVAFFTLEMPGEAILLRMAAARAQIDGLKVTQGWANAFERQELLESFSDLADPEKTKLWIDDTTGCTVPAMRASLRKLTARQSIGLVVIDYLQLVETSGGSDGRRYEQVSEISRGVKRLAREFSVPVVVLAQLNRDVDKESRKPRMSDLRDSGSIEQDADVILMPARQEGQDEQSDAIAVDLIIAKQRNGPLGKVPLRFLKRFAKFVEAEKSAHQTAL